MTNPFPPIRYADWLAQVQKDLKDPAAYESLRWQTPEGFTVAPYYTAEQLNTEPLAPMQAAQRQQPGWLNVPAPAYTIGKDDRVANSLLREAIDNGADALELRVVAPVNLSQLLQGIKLSQTPVYFNVSDDGPAFLKALQTIAPYQLRGGLFGKDPQSAGEIRTLLNATQDSPHFRVVHIDGTVFHNAGATATQELAFTLAQLVDRFDALTELNCAPDKLAAKTVLRMGVGTSYFLEIAKLRALRALLTRCASAYPFAANELLVHGVTSAFHETAATPYTNLLRGITEAMAAIVGGCDLLTVRPYDAVLNTSTTPSSSAFSQRIARNVSTLLRDESQLGRVADPAAGSYYIETLTHQLVEAAWTLFLEVENKGGLTQATNYVQEAIDSAYRAKVEAVRQGRVLVGVTRFRHDEPDERTATAASEKQREQPVRRLAAPFE